VLENATLRLQLNVLRRSGRPYQGIGQRIPGKPALVTDVTKPIVAKPVLEGLHHDYRRAA
jgi:hypothetical protein